MRKLVFALFVLMSSTPPVWAAGLTLSIHDGLVTLDAQDVTVRQILTEWARIGKTNIINVERITGGPITLQLDKVPEKQALDTILRSIPGYIALPRETLAADASVYDRILIMATTTAVAAPPPRPPQGVPTFPGMQSPMSGMPMPGGANVTQLRPMQPLSPGMLPESPNTEDEKDDAIANAAAAGLIPVPAYNPGPGAISAPLMLPGGPGQPQPQPQPALQPPGVGAPNNPWSVPAGTAQPSLATPQQQPQPQPQPTQRVRMPQPDR
jgi:hypothetical protein